VARPWVDGIHFDVLNNEFWPNTWPDRPDTLGASRELVAQRLAEAPALIPVYSHRAIPNEPLEAGNPRLLGHADRHHRLREESRRLPSARVSRPAYTEVATRTIRFWTAMLDADEI
jgi:hypothetical protein